MEHKDRQTDISASVRLFLGVLEKRKWIAIGVILAAVGLSLLFTSRQVPVYKASATVIIERRSPTVLSRVQEVMELGSSDYWSMKEYMQTQYEILKSRVLAKRVVDKLTLGLDERFLGLDRVKPPLTEAEKRARMRKMDPVGILLSRVSVEPRQDSQLVVVSVEDADPHMAQELANALVNEYKEQNLEYKKRVVTEAIAELRNMSARLRQEKESAEARVQEFERRHSMSSLASRKTQVEDRLKLLGEQHVQAVIARSEAESTRTREELGHRIDEVTALLATDDYVSASYPSLVQNSNIVNLKLRLVELDTMVRETQGRYGPKHPRMQAAYGQRSLVRKALRTEARILLESELASLSYRLEEETNKLSKAVELEEALRRQLQRAKEAEAELAKLELDYQPLHKRAEEAARIYEEVKARYSETTLSAQVETNNVRIQDLATLPQAPIRPHKKMNLLVGGLLGLLLGVAAAYFVESLDSSLKTREDVESIGHVAFLGLIPHVDEVERPESGVPHDSPELYVYHYPKSNIAEHFRTAKTNLFFSRSSGRPRRILVTSPGPKEGKTTVGVNLGAVSALAGSRTLVVDTDMRRPRVHKLLGIPRRPGITEFFMGTTPITRYCRPTQVEGLDVLSCGSIHPNPLEILESKKFWQMVEDLSEAYDTVIFDSPPLLAVADAKIICSMVDAVVLVVRAGQTTKEGLREARGMLYPAVDEEVGVILNGFDVEKHSYRYYYYRGKTYAYYNYYTYDEEGQDTAGKSETRHDRSMNG